MNRCCQLLHNFFHLAHCVKIFLSLKINCRQLISWSIQNPSMTQCYTLITVPVVQPNMWPDLSVQEPCPTLNRSSQTCCPAKQWSCPHSITDAHKKSKRCTDNDVHDKSPRAGVLLLVQSVPCDWKNTQKVLLFKAGSIPPLSRWHMSSLWSCGEGSGAAT